VKSVSSANAAVLTENSSTNKYQASTANNIAIYFTPPLAIPAGSVYRFIFDSDFTLSSVDSTAFLFFHLLMC